MSNVEADVERVRAVHAKLGEEQEYWLAMDCSPDEQFAPHLCKTLDQARDVVREWISSTRGGDEARTWLATGEDIYTRNSESYRIHNRVNPE